ncbi:MAG: sigma-54-dependent Fis family transcriptional regulator [Gammaproteobacteria bacterium]|nr:sigma-54-dependent Fis family transcriptional regulator [Gammaproteobacteria bacterium]
MNTQAQPTVLLVEDDAITGIIYKEFLSGEDVKVIHAEIGAEALAHIQQAVPDVIFLDLGLPDMNGMEILKHVRQHKLNSIVIVITAQNSVDIVVEAMRLGAFDFLVKTILPERFKITLRNALRHHALSQSLDFYEKLVKHKQCHNLVGTSRPMQTICHMISHIAASKASILITGESGTGKELCAEAIHQKSDRKDKPFVALNCAAIPNDLIENEIFGHLKGAFTGALSERQGAAARADGGTLFLDEIAEMALPLQSVLLRFVQTGTFYKVGGDKLEKVDIRFICATNRDLLAEVAAKRFREDLYYRLGVIHIPLPPLRERDKDVLLLARAFLKENARAANKSFMDFTPEAESLLLHHAWPGNVRQLQNVIQNIVLLHEGKTVTPDMFPSSLNETGKNRSDPAPKISQPREPPVPDQQAVSPAAFVEEAPPKTIRPFCQMEKEAIEEAIEFCNGNVVQAAKLLGLGSSTVYRKLRSWGAAFEPEEKSS